MVDLEKRLAMLEEQMRQYVEHYNLAIEAQNNLRREIDTLQGRILEIRGMLREHEHAEQEA